MTVVLTIRTSGDIVKASNVLTNIKHRLPQMCRKGMMRWGKILERDMKVSARHAENGPIRNFTGELYGKGIRYDQTPNSDVGRLFIRHYGVMLDSMKPHYVALTKRRTVLLRWAHQVDNVAIRKKAISISSGEKDSSGRLKKQSVYVRPHPFINSGYRRARPKLKAVLKRIAKNSVRAS